MTDQLAQGGLGEGGEPGDGTPPPADATATVPMFDAAAPPIDPAPTTETTATTSSDEPGEAEPAPPSGARRRPKRISKWDRQPDPHDWRFFVGNLGKVLIATGILMFGFVAYQLWGTGIETARAQNRLEGEFEQLLAEFADDEPEDPATPNETDDDTSEVGPDGDGDPAADVITTPDDPAGTADEAPPTAIDEAQPGTIVVGDAVEAGEVTPVAIDLSDQAVVQDPLPQPFRGDALFRLEIPAVGRDDIVVAGVSLNDLKAGPGHYPDTPLPGQLGNASVAGHRTTYGAPFFNVDQLNVGDELITTLTNGNQFVYEVTFIEVVEASAYHVITTRDPNISELTLTSCHPKYTARDRIVVHSVLNPAKSSTVGFPTFYELEVDDEPIPGDDPVLVADEPVDQVPVSAVDEPVDETPSGLAPNDDDPTESGQPDGAADDDLPATADPGDSAGDDSTGDDSEPAAAGTDDQIGSVGSPTDPGDDAELDAFSQGWFDDRAAFPQIALWGLALTLISIGAYRISRRFRHDSFGFMAGILPFLFCLYFFFQNVNRLLPPGL